MRRGPNRQVRLKSRPSGIPQAEHFEIVEAPVPVPSDGQVLVRNIYLSVDPAMRGWVSAVANYSEPVALGTVMRSLAVGRVEQSRDSGFHPGEYVTGMFGWQDYALVDAKAIERKVGGSGLPIADGRTPAAAAIAAASAPHPGSKAPGPTGNRASRLMAKNAAPAATARAAARRRS